MDLLDLLDDLDLLDEKGKLLEGEKVGWWLTIFFLEIFLSFIYSLGWT